MRTSASHWDVRHGPFFEPLDALSWHACSVAHRVNKQVSPTYPVARTTNFEIVLSESGSDIGLILAKLRLPLVPTVPGTAEIRQHDCCLKKWYLGVTERRREPILGRILA